MVQVDTRKRVLIVDDEANVRESLKMILGRHYSVDAVENGDRAVELLSQRAQHGTADPSSDEGADRGPEFPDVVLLDVLMPGLDGLGVLERVGSDYPGLPVIMLTASTTVKNAVQAMKLGAVDYLNKPFDVDELLQLVEGIVNGADSVTSAVNGISTLVHSRPNLPKVQGDFGCVVGRHPVMQELYRKVEQLAGRDTTILIAGESGTGKELVAREIHQRSPRANGPFIALNCAAIPETLIESELFGHEKGAFTHAVERRIGHFELADKGTLFLDEIGELSPAVQVKMLRFLQEQEFYRIGRSKPIRVDVRVLAATNQSLDTAVKEGRFRQDLFYRINVVSLELPPLRERVEDVEELAEYFLKRFSPLYGNKLRQLTPETLEVLVKYSWPGNVRELENIIESVMALSAGETIKPTDLPLRLRHSVNGNPSSGDVVEGMMPFEEAERAFETDIILKALRKANFVQTRAAELLGISRRILKYKMDKLGISEQSEAAG